MATLCRKNMNANLAAVCNISNNKFLPVIAKNRKLLMYEITTSSLKEFPINEVFHIPLQNQLLMISEVDKGTVYISWRPPVQTGVRQVLRVPVQAVQVQPATSASYPGSLDAPDGPAPRTAVFVVWRCGYDEGSPDSRFCASASTSSSTNGRRSRQ
jgi:hypothetical protein